MEVQIPERTRAVIITDYFMGLTFLATFFIGITGNVLSIVYFKSKPKDTATFLYLATACNDVLMLTLHLFSGLSLLANRDALVFSSDIFCTTWDILHFVTVKLSVLMVTILCLSRSYAVLFPLKHSHTTITPRYIGIFLIFITILIVSADLSMRALKYGASTWISHDAYCWMTSLNQEAELGPHDVLLIFYVFGTGLLAIPIIPVTIASLLTIYKIRKSIPSADKRKQSSYKVTRGRSDEFINISCTQIFKPSSLGQSTALSMKRHATNTVLLFTSAYIVFSIPLFINYVIYVALIYTDMRLYDRLYTENTVMYYYVWNFTDVLCVSINAMINPIIYVWRIRAFRKWVQTVVLQNAFPSQSSIG